MAIMSGGPTQVAMSVMRAAGSIRLVRSACPGEGSDRRREEPRRDRRANVHVGDAGLLEA